MTIVDDCNALYKTLKYHTLVSSKEYSMPAASLQQRAMKTNGNVSLAPNGSIPDLIRDPGGEKRRPVDSSLRRNDSRTTR
jgi:hypothetical protein